MFKSKTTSFRYQSLKDWYLKEWYLKAKSLVVGVILLLAFFGITAYAAELRYDKTGIELMIPPQIQVEPGNFGTLVFTFKNRTSATKSFYLSCSSELGWTIIGGRDHLLLKPGQEEYVVLSILLPTNVSYGTVDTIRLTIKEERHTQRGSVYSTEVAVKMVRKLTINAPKRMQGKAGATLKIPVLLTNQGSVTETLDYAALSESGWEINWEIPQTTLAPGESLSTVVLCKIPETAMMGQTDHLDLRLNRVPGGSQGLSINQNVSPNKGIDSTRHNEARVMIIVNEPITGALGVGDMTIPLHSNINLNLRPPVDDGEFSWLGSFRLTGQLHPGLNMDFFFSGEGEDDDSVFPSLYLALTGQHWQLRTGAFDSGWDGMLDAPTSTAMFYFQRQTPTKQSQPWRLWVGSKDELFSSPQWVGASLAPNERIILNFLHSMQEDSLYSDALEAQYTPAGFLTNPDWDFTISGVAGAGTEDSQLLSQGKISLTRYQPWWSITGELVSGDEFYRTLYQTERFTKLTLYSGIEATSLLAVEPLFEYKMAKDASGRSRITKAYQTSLFFEDNRFLLRHEDDYGEATNRFELDIWNKLSTDEAIALTMEFSETQPHLFPDQNSLETFSISFKTREKLSPVDRLENYISHNWYEEGSRKKSYTGYGLRWSFSSDPKWQNDGFFQLNNAVQQGIHPVASQFNIGYRVNPSTTLKLGNTLLVDTDFADYSVSLFLFHQDMLLLPLPWGGIKGRVYADRNYNDLLDYGENGIEGVKIYLDGKEETVSAPDGTWLIPRVKPGQHRIYAGGPQNQNYFGEGIQYDLEIESNIMTGIDMPLYPPLNIRGLLFLDENKNETPDPRESFLSGVTLEVRQVQQTAEAEKFPEEALMEVTTQFDGSFFLNLQPGDYILAVLAETLPEEVEPPAPVSLTINKDSVPVIFFALAPKAKEVEFSDLDLPSELLDILQ